MDISFLSVSLFFLRCRVQRKHCGGTQGESVGSMAAVAATFQAEQISWPEEKDKHGRGNRV